MFSLKYREGVRCEGSRRRYALARQADVRKGNEGRGASSVAKAMEDRGVREGGEERDPMNRE